MGTGGVMGRFGLVLGVLGVFITKIAFLAVALFWGMADVARNGPGRVATAKFWSGMKYIAFKIGPIWTHFGA